MSGAYAHITIVNHAQKMAGTSAISNEAKHALGRHLKYAELGSVSPDYPYLAAGQSHWADNMHYQNTSVLLRSGVEKIQGMTGTDREKAMSWFFGFAGHMATDMTIHPIVESIVGPYKGNESAHRKCEMHQDSHIFQKMDLGDLGLTEHLKSGIASCHASGDDKRLDEAISAVWLTMLKAAYPSGDQIVVPEPDKWHRGFTGLLKALTTANRLFPFSRHVATNLNLTYPEVKEIDSTYIHNLKTPETRMSYDAVFERACKNVVSVWEGLDMAVSGKSTAFLDSLVNWDLDTGRAVTQHSYVFWKKEVA